MSCMAPKKKFLKLIKGIICSASNDLKHRSALKFSRTIQYVYNVNNLEKKSQRIQLGNRNKATCTPQQKESCRTNLLTFKSIDTQPLNIQIYEKSS